MTLARHRLATFWALVWGSPFGRWSFIVLAVVIATAALMEPFLGALCSFAWLGLSGLVWCGLALSTLVEAYRDRRFWTAVYAPIVALCAVVALSLPSVWLGGRLHAYIVLAENYSSYSKEAAAESIKASPKVLMWSYGGWLSDEEMIVWDMSDQPEQRAPALMGGGTATCHRLIGHYYDCGIWF